MSVKTGGLIGEELLTLCIAWAARDANGGEQPVLLKIRKADYFNGIRRPHCTNLRREFRADPMPPKMQNKGRQASIRDGAQRRWRSAENILYLVAKNHCAGAPAQARSSSEVRHPAS